MPITYRLIQSTTLGTATNTVAFNSIPQTYTDLVLRTSVRNSGNAAQANLTFNGNTSSIYFSKGYYTDMVTQFGLGTSGQAFAQIEGIGAINASLANTFNTSEFYFGNYSNTSFAKQFFYTTRSENNATEVYFTGSLAYLFNSTSAISSISLSFVNNSVIGSTFDLYGITRN